MGYDTNVNKVNATTLGHLQAYELKKTALDQLRPNFTFYQVCEPDRIGSRSGRTRRWFRYTNMAANTTVATEGSVGSGIAGPQSKILDATAAQYADFMTLSDLLVETAPDDILQAFAEQLGFRAGLTGDTVVRTVIDAESSAVSSLLGVYLTAKDARGGAYILEGRNVFQQSSGWFEMLVHPYNAFDIVNDPTAAGFLDIYKYTDPSKAAAVQISDRGGEVGTVSGVRIKKSTNVKLTAGTPNMWRAYLFGRGAVGTVSLGAQPFNQVADPAKETFTVNSKMLSNSGDLANPMGLIRGLVSYKYTLVAKVLSGASPMGGQYRYIMWDAPSSIVA